MRQETVNLECQCCHKEFEISTLYPRFYNNSIIRDNWICINDVRKVIKSKLKLTCVVCHNTFTTYILESYKGSLDGCTCIKCSGLSNTVLSDSNDVMLHKLAVHRFVFEYSPDIKYPLDFTYFDFSKYNKNITILFVFDVDMNRDDIFSLKYFPLKKQKYFLNKGGIVLEKRKCKDGTVVHLKKYKDTTDCTFFAKQYSKEENWIVSVRNYINRLFTSKKEND